MLHVYIRQGCNNIFSLCGNKKREQKVEKNSTGVAAAIQLKKKRFQEIRKMVGFVDGVKNKKEFVS
jgi:hypothetical protein